MKNTKSKIELIENEINSKARKAYATTVARRDAERCGDIPVTCTPAVAAVRPVKAEFLRHPTHAPECSVNVGLAHGEICNCHRMLNPVTSELAAKFAAGWKKSIEAGSVRVPSVLECAAELSTPEIIAALRSVNARARAAIAKTRGQ